MRILILEGVPERGPVIETEGAKMFLALRQLGHAVTLTGQGFTDDLRGIPELSQDFDACLLCENYPQTWGWSAFEDIDIPKIFWAIDSSHQSFPFVVTGDFQHVLFNNYSHIDEFMSKPNWAKQVQGHTLFPYAVDPGHPSGFGRGESYEVPPTEGLHELVFCGTLSPDRAERIRILEQSTGKKVSILGGYGQAYVDSILAGKLHLNLPILGDFNARHMDVIGLGRIPLTPFQVNSAAVIPERYGLYFHSLIALQDKIEWLLTDVEARRRMEGLLLDYVLREHTYERRARTLGELVMQIF